VPAARPVAEVQRLTDPSSLERRVWLATRLSYIALGASVLSLLAAGTLWYRGAPPRPRVPWPSQGRPRTTRGDGAGKSQRLPDDAPPKTEN
jgi:hypothetical protein